MKLTVVIPTLNRAGILDTTLASFRHIDSAQVMWQVIVVDNGSADETPAVVERYSSTLPVRYLREEKPGKNHANNLAIEHSEGDILVFTDDDITPSPNWLREILASAHRWPDCRVFGGRVRPIFDVPVSDSIRNAWFSRFVFAEHDLACDEGEYPEGTSPVGPNCWFRRDLFDNGWRYDTTIGPVGGSGRRLRSGSELEFFTRLRNAGESLVYVPNASVDHRIQSYQTRWQYLLRRSYASGRGHVCIHGVPIDAKRWYGVPRYLYRQMIEAAGAAAYDSLRLRYRNSFSNVMRLAMLAGACSEARLQACESMPASEVPGR